MKILLISCGGTIVSPVAEGGVQAAEKATAAAVRHLTDSILPLEMIQELNRRASVDYQDSVVKDRDSFCISSGDHGAAQNNDSVAEDPKPLSVITLTDVDSTEVGPRDWGAIISCVLENYDRYDGFIVTHGTNTLAYTASALTFGLPRIGKPVVMTGANIPLGLPFSDATTNASNALLLVQKMIASGLTGIVVVFASRVIPGPRAKKANGNELEAFTTFNASNIGQMRPKKTVIFDVEFNRYVSMNLPDSPWYGKELARNAADLRTDAQTNFEAIISSHTFHPGDDPSTYLAVLEELNARRQQQGTRGALIIRAVGDGDVSTAIRNNVFKRAKELEVPIVVTTQEPSGTSTFTSNKLSEGVEADFSVIPAGDMSIETMVVKLRYLLAKKLDYEAIHEEFVKSYHGEIKLR